MTRLVIIIPAAILEAVRATAAAAFGDVAHGEFVPAGSSTGDEPATHWWLSGEFAAADYATVQQLAVAFPTAHMETYELATDPGRPWEMLSEMGLQPLKPQLGTL